MGVKSFDLKKNEFLLKRANYLSCTRPNIASKYSITKFLHTRIQFMWSKFEKKNRNYNEN